MATGSDFPTSKDSFAQLADNIDDILVAETNKQSSAIEALQTEVGITGSSDTNSLRYKADNVILTDPSTTRGDLLKRGASALGRLAVGANLKILGSDGTDPAWTNEHETLKHLRPYTYGESITAGDSLYLKTSDGKAYKALATAASTMYPFIGFATESGVADEVKMVTYDFIVLSGLTAGDIYYMDASTPGAITNTAPALAKRVGVAISTTILAINREVGQMSFFESNCTIQKYLDTDVESSVAVSAELKSTTNWVRTSAERYIRVGFTLASQGNNTGGSNEFSYALGEIRVNTVARAKAIVSSPEQEAANNLVQPSNGNYFETILDLDDLSIAVGATVTVDFYLWGSHANVVTALGTGFCVYVNAVTVIN